MYIYSRSKHFSIQQRGNTRHYEVMNKLDLFSMLKYVKANYYIYQCTKISISILSNANFSTLKLAFDYFSVFDKQTELTFNVERRFQVVDLQF